MAYRWLKRNYKLTKDQKERGVVFSSLLINHTLNQYEELHEVFEDDADKHEKINNLKDVRFFKGLAQELGYSCELIERN